MLVVLGRGVFTVCRSLLSTVLASPGIQTRGLLKTSLGCRPPRLLEKQRDGSVTLGG